MSDNSSLPQSKRPYATLDLKATEIKVTPIGDKFPNIEPEMPPIGPVPWPAPARTFAALAAATEAVKAGAASTSAAPAAKPSAASRKRGGSAGESQSHNRQSLCNRAAGPTRDPEAWRILLASRGQHHRRRHRARRLDLGPAGTFRTRLHSVRPQRHLRSRPASRQAREGASGRRPRGQDRPYRSAPCRCREIGRQDRRDEGDAVALRRRDQGDAGRRRRR